MKPVRPTTSRTSRPTVAAGALLAGVLLVAVAAPAVAAPPAANPAVSASRQNAAPAAPADLTTYPPRACGTIESPTLFSRSMLTATFTARLYDPNGNNVGAHLEIRRGVDDTLAYGPAISATVPSGASVTWTVPDSALLAYDTVYYYQAWATDTHHATGPTTEPCYFTVDGVAPGEPTITVGTLLVDVPGPVTFTPAAGDDDIAGYRYGFNNNVSEWVAADATGAATIWVTLTEDPFFPGSATADLWVQAVDTAGNGYAGVIGPILLFPQTTTP
ncbi:hypothetical protein OG792_20155 [Micromonospora sp. NBC_01699]|uniref:hypothetical protein n=1 Tax=Micromonospora sp. NBC_01699 TaxID=2975984 RepID=UPI002E2E32AE|nr:hypothetical protein [Micromonospora sp. NBC_01699]